MIHSIELALRQDETAIVIDKFGFVDTEFFHTVVVTDKHGRKNRIEFLAQEWAAKVNRYRMPRVIKGYW